MATKTKKYRCWHNLTGEYDLIFDDNKLLVRISMPYLFRYVMILDSDSKEIYSKYYITKECKCRLNLPPGRYYFNLYGSHNAVYYESYLGGKQIALEFNESGEWYFVLPEYTKWNRNLVENNLLDHVLSETLLDNNHTMRRVAMRLTSNCNTIREKVLAIHDFVAKNLYYDYDSLNTSDWYRTIEQIAQTKRCVCQGYADFVLVLLSCVGIQAENILCFAVENIFKHGWSDAGNRKSEVNHIITRVRLENRWLYMDVTWDSKNRYENGQYIKANKISHRYFDVTLPFLSSTHRFFERK